MRRVVFVNPPSLMHNTHDLAPPLWALLLGAIAKREGYDPTLVDFNLEVLDKQVAPDCERFYASAISMIGHFDPDIVCYSSMALNSHVALRLAAHLKAEGSPAVQLFGGPHFSAVAEELLAYYPCVDGVVLGEGEVSFGQCLRALRSGQTLRSLTVPGLLTRFAPVRPLVKTAVAAAKIPKPAYELSALPRYFKRNPRRLLDFEAARRGCIYACRYCYAPGHFGRGERGPSMERFLEELSDASDLGAKHLFVVTDNFINYPGATAELCEEIARAELGITFHCYATLAQLDGRVVSALARAGCTSVYVGVDAVHPDARREFAKGLFRSRDDMLSRIDLCLAHGIVPNLAFLLEEPERSSQRFEDTVATALAGALRGCSVALNTLTIYPRTPLAEERKWDFYADDLKARICFDAPDAVLCNPYSSDHPELFPFHASHRSGARNGRLLVMAHALKTLIGCAPAPLYAICEDGVLLEFLDAIVKDVEPSAFAAMGSPDRRRLVVDRFLQLCNQAKVVNL